LTVRHS